MLLMTRWKGFSHLSSNNCSKVAPHALYIYAHFCFLRLAVYQNEYTLYRIVDDPLSLDCFSDPMELMEQQLVRCGVAPVRLYEHLAMSTPVAVAAAAAAALGAQQQHQQPSAQQQQQQHENSGGHALPPWLSPSAALLYGTRGAAGSPSPYPAVAAAAAAPGFPYPAALSWPWQPPPPVAMISRRSSPPTATGLRYAPYPPTASTPPPLRARPSTPN